MEISRLADTEDLLQRFAGAMGRKPRDVYDEVDPYLYAVALFLKQDMSAITRARVVENPHGYKWINEILGYMENTVVPVRYIKIEQASPTFSVASSPMSRREIVK